MGFIVFVMMLFAVGGVAWYAVTIYNGLVALRNDIDKAWANIDVMLKQRHDELTNLVEVCKGYMEYERETFVKLAEARSMWTQARTVDQKAHADRSATEAASKLFAVAENYPELKANDNFMQLESRITALESQIADRREFYNDSVNTFNTRMQQMPDAIIANFMQLHLKPMFKADASERTPMAMTFAVGR